MVERFPRWVSWCIARRSHCSSWPWSLGTSRNGTRWSSTSSCRNHQQPSSVGKWRKWEMEIENKRAWAYTYIIGKECDNELLGLEETNHLLDETSIVLLWSVRLEAHVGAVGLRCDVNCEIVALKDLGKKETCLVSVESWQNWKGAAGMVKTPNRGVMCLWSEENTHTHSEWIHFFRGVSFTLVLDGNKKMDAIKRIILVGLKAFF